MKSSLVFKIILLLFPMLYYGHFLTSWMRFPPQLVVLILLVLSMRGFEINKKVVKYYFFLLFIAIFYSIFYIGDFPVLIVNLIKLTSLFLMVEYFDSLNRIDLLIKYSVVLSLISFLVYIIGFFDLDLNFKIREVFNGSGQRIQEWSGLPTSQFIFGYEIIPLGIYLMSRSKIYFKALGMLSLLLSPQRSVLNSFVFIFNRKKRGLIVIFLLSTLALTYSDLVLDFFNENFEYNVFKKDEISSSTNDSRLQMVYDGFELLLAYPFGSVIHNISWDEAIKLNGYNSFIGEENILAPHNIIVYTLFIFGIIPGLVILFYYLRPLISALFSKNNSDSRMISVYVSLGLFMNALFHNSSFINMHSITIIFYFIALSQITKDKINVE